MEKYLLPPMPPIIEGSMPPAPPIPIMEGSTTCAQKEDAEKHE